MSEVFQNIKYKYKSLKPTPTAVGRKIESHRERTNVREMEFTENYRKIKHNWNIEMKYSSLIKNRLWWGIGINGCDEGNNARKNHSSPYWWWGWKLLIVQAWREMYTVYRDGVSGGGSLLPATKMRGEIIQVKHCYCVDGAGLKFKMQPGK